MLLKLKKNKKNKRRRQSEAARLTGPPGHQARPSPPIGQARSPAGQAAQARSAGPAQYRWWPIKGRRLGFEDPNRPLCRAAAAVGCSSRRRRHQPTLPGHRRCQAAVPPCLQVSNPLSPSSSHGEHKTRPWRPAGGAKPPVPGELRSIEPSLQAGAWRIRPRRPFRWHSEVRSRLPRGRGRSESGTKRRPCAAD